MSTTFLVLLLLGTALAATHVNISIAQNPVTNPADVTYVDGRAPAELRAGPADKQHFSDFGYYDDGKSFQGHPAKLQAADNGQKGSMQQQLQKQQHGGFNYDGYSARVQAAGGAGGQMLFRHHEQPQGFNGRYRHQQSQLRQPNEQAKQNQEFERYIQSYHSGPTVETVFDTASQSPQPKRYQQEPSSLSSSMKSQRVVAIGSRPTQLMHTFERQVALPTAVTAQLPAVDVGRQTNSNQPKTSADATLPKPSVSSSTSTLSSTSSSALPSSLPSGNNQFDQATSYNKPNYDESNFNYNAAPTIDFNNEYPPSVDESQDGYAGFYGGNNEQQNFYGLSQAGQSRDYSPNTGYDQASQSGDYLPKTGFSQASQSGDYSPNTGFSQSSQSGDYSPNTGFSQASQSGDYSPNTGFSQSGDYSPNTGLNQATQSGGYSPVSAFLPQQPAYQRPVVTKTIQIAQPALKAKKFEVRHPAIQKEFYDIEERVIIKPAGTIVVELDRPVAKILKGESILPLGHLHPAVAGAYNTNGQEIVQTQSSNTGTYSNSPSSFSSSHQYKQSNPVYISKSVPDHPALGSTTLASKVTATPSYDQNSKDELVEANLNRQYKDGALQFATTTEANFNEDKLNNQQQEVSNDNLPLSVIGKDEPDFHYPSHVDVNNNGAPLRAKNQQSSYNYNTPSQPQFDANFNNANNEFKSEYLPVDFYNNINNQADHKPARLQAQPVHGVADNDKPRTHIIKHEHNIHLSPSQHNIYLGRLQQNPAQSAQLKNSRFEEEAARVLEVKPYLHQHKGPVVVYASTAVRPATTRYSQSNRALPQVSQQLRYGTDGDGNRVQYSAPYSNMRYLPQEPAARLTQANSYSSGDNSNRAHINKANLVTEDSQEDLETPPLKIADDKELHPHTHIQIQIPHPKHDGNKPIVVSSTISPPLSHQRTASYRQPHSNPSSGYNDEVERFNPLSNFHRGDQENGFAPSANLELKPDCDQPTARNFNAQQNNVNYQGPQFSRLIEATNPKSKDDSNAAVPNIQTDSVDVNSKGSSGHVAVVAPGQRVIAATPAPTDASSGSESFHKRRIAVNHPFQTVREVVEHEPITNYHQIQVNEPALPEHYHEAPYQHQTHGALRQDQPLGVVYQHSASTHGNLQYAVPSALPVHDVSLSYHHRRAHQV